MTLISELDQHAKYLSPMSFSSEVTVHTHTHTHRHLNNCSPWTTKVVGNEMTHLHVNNINKQKEFQRFWTNNQKLNGIHSRMQTVCYGHKRRWLMWCSVCCFLGCQCSNYRLPEHQSISHNDFSLFKLHICYKSETHKYLITDITNMSTSMTSQYSKSQINQL